MRRYLRRRRPVEQRHMLYAALMVTLLYAPRPAQARGASGWVSVLNWKCVADGVADDSACFQNAVDHLSSGGTLYLPAHRADGMPAV